ncbi:MAG TPA: HEAT repeat domain-containing protein [Gemmataceae bacterium]|jgi:HEAT repeat protein
MLLAPLALLAAQAFVVQKLPLQPQQPIVAPKPALSDEQVVKNAHLDSAGPALVTFFRQRVRRQADPKQLAELTKKLGDKDPKVHTKAAAELVGLGSLALPALRRAVNQADDEAALSRARKCVESIEGQGGAAVVASAVRLLTAHNPDGAADALLDYLPFADNDHLVQEIETALQTVGLQNGKPASALVRALSDAAPVRRSIAAHVLCRIGGTSGRANVRALLKDPKPSVRKQAALGLADSHDAEAVPVLIDLVADLPPDGRKEVETYLTELAGDWTIKTPQGNDATSSRLRRELWSAWWRSLDGKHLLEEFTNRTLSDEDRTRILGLLKKLDDVSPDVRAKASEEIIGVGAKTAPMLRQVIAQPRSRLTAAARQCLEAIERDTGKPLPDAAPRLLALRRPEGTVEALIGYLPFAESETVANQLIQLLASVGVIDGKADPALVRALENKVNARRAAAAVALCKGDANDDMPAVRKLLRDEDATVRMRTGFALADRGEKAAVPVLIALLGELPLEQVWEVEDLLIHLAGDKGPTERISREAATRTASVAAWKAWWRKEEKTVDLARLHASERDQGLMLLVEMQQGRVVELNRSGQVRWKIEGLQWPWDAAVCPNGNVLVIHMSGNQLSLRDRQGKEIWQKPINQGFSCQRLRNGNFFVACRNHLVEFDANGKELSSQPTKGQWVVGGCKFKDGHMAYVTQQGQYVRLDSHGKQVKTFQVNMQGGVVMNAEILPGDRMVAALNIGKVVEYDGDGKQVWEAAVPNPGFPHKAPNGHTVVPQNSMPHLFEFDGAGKSVADKKDLEYRPFRVRRR